MRRKDREITEFDEIVEVIKKCQVCRLGLNGDDGYPYVLPLNFGLEVIEGKIRLGFHSALEGHKVNLIKNDSRAAFEMDCENQLFYDEKAGFCTYMFESVMGKGKISILGNEDKMKYLENLMDHYYPGKNKYFNPAALSRTLVYVLDVEEITCKRKLPPKKMMKDK